MAELGLNRLDARALGDEQARAGVAKIMEPRPVEESRPGRAGMGWARPTPRRTLRAMRKSWKCLLGWHAYVRDRPPRGRVASPNQQVCRRCGKKRNIDALIWPSG
jgi:hypothetical protein